jgi:hypothetical protein
MAGRIIMLTLIILQSGITNTTKENEPRRRVNFGDIKYKFQCGTVECDGIIQYCTEEETCGYCSEDLCEAPDPPPQCQIQCWLNQNKRGKDYSPP